MLSAMAAIIVVAVVLLAAGCGGGLEEARSFDSQGDIEGAIVAYRAVLAETPEDVEALTGLAVDLIMLGRFDEALPVQEKVVALNQDDVQTRIELGFNYLNHQNRPADAVRVLSEAALLDPSARNLTYLSQAHMRAGRTVDAEIALREAIQNDPQYPHSYSVLMNLLQTSGRADEAERIEALALENGVTLSTLVNGDS